MQMQLETNLGGGSGVWFIFPSCDLHFGAPFGFWDLAEAGKGDAKMLRGKYILGVMYGRSQLLL